MPKEKPKAASKTAAPKTALPKGKTCLASRCKKPGVSEGYCRLHYIVHWKKIRGNRKEKAERRLNSYVDRLMKKYPEGYLEKIKESLESEEKFKDTMQEVDLEVEGEATESDREYLEKLTRKIGE